MRIQLPLIQSQTPAPPARDVTSRSGDLPDRLVDSYGRVIRDLRLSLTDRCNFRCLYCMEPDVRFKRRVDLLTDAEFLRLARIFRSFGIERVRLTGGEPTLHPTLPDLIADLTALGFKDIAMTTNGSLATLSDMQTLQAAGLRRLTISLDTLDPDRFASLTRANTTPERVIEAIRNAKQAGLNPVKVNTVVIRGLNDDELPSFARLAREFDIEVRFIEFMPLDSARRWGREQVVTADEMVQRLGEAFPLRPIGRPRKSTPATSYAFTDDGPGKLGIIASVSRPFCGACSRVRITADGMLMPCLFSRAEWDLRAPLRSGAPDEDIARLIIDATNAKQSGHTIANPDYLQPDRPMSAIGG